MRLVYPATVRRSLRLWVGAATVVVLLGWWLLLRPTALGGVASYVVVFGASMEPVLRSGDLVVVTSSDHYVVGEIVAFRTDGGLVVHRIVGGDDSGFIVQGDNRATRDVWRPRPSDIVGGARLRVPLGGRVAELLRTPPAMGLLVGAAVFALVAGSARGSRSRAPS